MRFVSYEADGQSGAGIVDGDVVLPLVGVSELGRETPAELLAAPPVDETRPLSLADVRLRPVIPSPGKIICVGLNYLAHVTESGRTVPEYPALFPKFATSLVGPFDPIRRPVESEQLDYEAELAFVIGRPARRVAPEEALDVVAGFTVANDVTVRDYQYRSHQWMQGKAWDATTPLGPTLVTPDEVGGDARGLRISLTLNGRVMQDSTTDLMIHDVATLVSIISTFTTLMPGDVVLTGTPAGVGIRREPAVFLQPGDVVTVEVEHIGHITNEVVSEARDKGDLP